MSVNEVNPGRPVGGNHESSRGAAGPLNVGTEIPSDTGKKASGKPQRAMAVLGRGRSVIVVGRNLDLDAWLEALQEALTKGRRAKSYGLSLEAFLRMSRDIAQ